MKSDASNTSLRGGFITREYRNLVGSSLMGLKKLHQQKKRYEIAEKEMLGVISGIKKIKYELGGAKFHLITDHKTLQNMSKKLEFGNNRINRWIENIQKYDFKIEYKKESELVVPDALSRIY